MSDTTLCENMLRELILAHGIETVQTHLDALYGRARHSDYMRVVALAKNVNNQIERNR